MKNKERESDSDADRGIVIKKERDIQIKKETYIITRERKPFTGGKERGKFQQRTKRIKWQRERNTGKIREEKRKSNNETKREK